jgi:hypothetical protein
MVALAAAAVFSVLSTARPSVAEETLPTAPTDEPPVQPPAVVRVSLSKQASAFLTEGRVRRLIELELPSTTRLAEDPTGPLDENAVHLYVDLPEPSVVTIPVQAPQRKVETRRVDVAGLAWDVAARVTAIAASESVRSAIAPIVKRPTAPRGPTDAELRDAFDRTPSIGVSGSFAGAVLPSVAVLGGSRLAVSFHQRFFLEELAIGAYGGSGSASALRSVDLSALVGYRVYYSSRLRSDFGGVFAFSYSSLRLDESAGDDGGFGVRAAGRVTLDLRVADRTWLTLGIEPGGVLVDSPPGVRGAWFGANLGVAYDSLLSFRAAASGRGAAGAHRSGE